MADTSRPGLAETVFIWALLAPFALAIVVTYARLPVAELYNVSENGFVGGASRALVFVGWPGGLAAVAVLLVLVQRLEGRASRLVALVAAGLCATIAVPGVIDQGDLDARPINALAAVGVGIALALTALALMRGGLGVSLPLARPDAVRIGIGAVLLLAAIPWLAAELGFSVSDAPVLGSIFLGEQRTSVEGQESLIAVHLGDHHGMVGTLLAWIALALSRVLPQMRSIVLRVALAVYLSLMFVYGLANALQDFWLEQLVKRGTTSIALPSVIRPSLSWAWAAMLGTALLICLAVLRVVRGDQRRGGQL